MSGASREPLVGALPDTREGGRLHGPDALPGSMASSPDAGGRGTR